MLGKIADFLMTWIEAVMSTLAVAFMDAWTVIEQSYRRPFSHFMVRAKFVVYPLIAVAALFGAIAVAREFGHHTVIPTFLASPRRHRAVLAQFGAVAVGGSVLSVVGTALTIVAVALALPTTEFRFLISGGHIVQLLGAAMLAGATGAVLGAGLGALIRTVGGAVTGVTIALIIAPPLIVQLASETASWMPGVLANVLSGTGSDVTVPSAIAALAAWALIPAALGLVAVQRRDVA